MSTLDVTRSLIAGTNPTETQFDTMRTDLLTFFNTTKLETSNLAEGGLTLTSLGGAGDDVALSWTDSDAAIEYVSASTTFRFENSQGDIVFKNTLSSSTTESLRLKDTGVTQLGSGGLLKLGQGQGSLAVDTLYLFARYRKPRLEYTSDDVITSENNTGTASETVLILRDRLITMVDRTMSLAATANGYDAADTGAAVSGLRDGLSRVANTWYYIYAALVQYGSDANGAKAIMIADTTSPVQANCSTLDTRFGAGKWVYLGVIRNGYNDGTNTNIIVQFIQDGYGVTEFTTTYESGKGIGVTLATATASSADLTYSIATGTGTADIPVVASRAVFSCYRSEQGFEVDYHYSISGEDNMRVTSCNVGYDPTTNAVVEMDVPIIANYQVILRVGADATNQRIKLSALTDHYV